MAYSNLTEMVEDVAGAIRDKDGTNALIPVADFGDRIRTIPSGGVWIIPKPDENVVGNYYVALAYGDLGSDQASSNISIAYGNASTVTSGGLAGAIEVRTISCFTNTALTTPITISATQLVGLWFGSLFNATSLPTSFLGYCRSFNQPLDIPSPVNTINNALLTQCTAFNQPITLPSTLTTIGETFVNCQAFNQPLVIPNSVTKIGSSFLSGASSFNSPLVLSTNLQSLGLAFLTGAYSFNQPLTIPSSVNSFLGNILQNTHNFTSLLTYNSSVYPTGNTLYTTFASAPMYTKGVPVTGTGAVGLMSAFPNSSSSPYRNLRLV